MPLILTLGGAKSFELSEGVNNSSGLEVQQETLQLLLVRGRD
jgi:hypothetical protein